MHNLAIALHEKGYVVTGSDDEFFEPSKSRLAAKGLLPSQTGWHPETLTADIDAVILGMHAMEDNPELRRAKELGLKIYSFPEYLYEQTSHEKRIVVGGSHGKTTTTAMIMYVLRKCGVQFDYMVGAQVEGFETMVGLSETARIAVFEGDEYLTSALDRTSKFLHYHPDIAIITGIAWDHVNVFPTFEGYVGQFRKFAESVIPGGTIIYCAADPEVRAVVRPPLPSEVEAVGYEGLAWRVDSDDQVWATIDGEEVRVGVFGQHNMQNMNAAMLACERVGVTRRQFAEAISTFEGASRRLQTLSRTEDSVTYLDFAHSPSKLRATINAVRDRHRGRRVIACMELHTFSSLTKDFLPQYAHSMDGADRAIVYYDPSVIEHKRLAQFDKEEVQSAFGHRNLTVCTSATEVEAAVGAEDRHGSVLLLMTSGNFGGAHLS